MTSNPEPTLKRKYYNHDPDPNSILNSPTLKVKISLNCN